MNANEEAVATVLASYQDALNASNTDAVMRLYAEDGVFMPPYSQSAIGVDAVRQAYDAVFKAIKLSVKFNVAEVVEIAPNWTFARTNSAGTVTVNATGVNSAEANQELFIFKKGADGSWKIARYSFSSTNPLPQP
ncbi:YybH family protein [Candidatus Binatus sp.]|uniref:YybH family protein n=1 Tax=Candidatus Binatus sp. TaxID=2811406 RepID=UPI003C8045B4